MSPNPVAVGGEADRGEPPAVAGVAESEGVVVAISVFEMLIYRYR
jgi:hypothetical protein